MKFLRTIGYLITVVLVFWLGTVQNKQVARLYRGKANTLLLQFVAVAMQVTSFVQFWMLTGIFPWVLLLVLIGAALLASMLNMVLLAIVGVDVAGKREKVRILPLIWAAQKPAMSCTFVVIATLYWVVSTLLSLWIFWRHRLGDPIAVGWIAFIDFIVPPILFTPFIIAFLWPVVTSEYLDDDVRNAYLCERFSAIVTSTVALLFPVWIFRNQLGNAFGALPPFWLLVSIPMLLFLVGGALPFFVGMYRFRAHAKMLLEWRERWLEGTLGLLLLPDAAGRAQRYDNELDQLKKEIETRTAENELLSFYRDIVAPDVEILPGPAMEPRPALPDPAASAAAPGALSPKQVEFLDTVVIKSEGLDKMSRKLPWTPAPVTPAGEKNQIDVIEIVREHREKLVEWDVRFANLFHLLNLYRSASDGRSLEIRAYLEGELKSAKASKRGASKTKNVLAGAFLSGTSAAIVWVFKTYQTQIIELIGRLAHTM